MNVTELRIGNYVKTPYGISKVKGVDRINEKNSYIEIYNEIPKTYNISFADFEIEPIPLTEEILSKCGFSDFEYKEGYIGIDYRSEDGIFTDFTLTKPFVMGEWQDYYAFDLMEHRFLDIQYLHELQNLYFIVTKQELDIHF